MLSTSIIIFLVLGAAFGGFVNGLAGTGTALFSLGFYLVVLPPVSAVAIVSLLVILTGVQSYWVARQDFRPDKTKFLQFTLPGLLGVPIGVMLLDSINVDSLRICIAILLIAYGGYFSFRAVLPSVAIATPKIDMCVGLTSGVLGGMSSVSGALPVMWLSMRPWSKGEIRAVLQPFNMLVLSATAILLLAKGAYDGTVLSALLVTIPVALIASRLGIYVFKRLSDELFRQMLIGLSLLMGLGLLLQTLA